MAVFCKHYNTYFYAVTQYLVLHLRSRFESIAITYVDTLDTKDLTMRCPYQYQTDEAKFRFKFVVRKDLSYNRYSFNPWDRDFGVIERDALCEDVKKRIEDAYPA